MTLTTTTALQFNQIMRQSSLIIISILLAKSGLSTADIGIYESLLFIGATVTIFWMSALTQGTLSYYATISELDKRKVKFNIFLIFNILNIILFFVLIIFKAHILTLLIGKSSIPFYNLYILYLVLNLPAIALESFWTVENTPLSIVAYAIISHLLLPIAMIVPIWLGKGLELSIVCTIGLAIIRYTWLIIDIIKNNYFKIDFSIIQSFLLLCLPLMAYFLLGSLSTAFSNWIVNWHYKGDLDIFAIFRYGARELPLTMALMVGLSNAIVPQLVPQTGMNSINTEGVALLRKKSLRLYHWLFPISTILILSSKTLFPIVFNPFFKESATVFNVFLLFVIIRALFPQSIMLALRETKTMLWISIAEVLVIIVLSFLLIIPLGMIGVAWAMFGGYLFEKVVMIVFLYKKYQIAWHVYTDVKWFLGYSVVLLLAYLCSC